jgi:hypothetical protein
MKRSLEEDLARLEKLAFKRRERCGPLVQRFHGLADSIGLMGEAEWIWNVYEWLLVPLTLWPVDFEGVAVHTIRVVEGKAKMDRAFGLLLRMLKEPPGRKTQETIAQYEHDIEEGQYHRMLRQPAHDMKAAKPKNQSVPHAARERTPENQSVPHPSPLPEGEGKSPKFQEMERGLEADEELAAMWEEIKEQFPTSKYRNRRGVIRRRLSQERNFREGWRFDWSDPRSRFYSVFDAFCYAWDLYGMEKDKPLLMKVSVNPTPYGTLIFIPRTWSFDAYRDLDWGAIARLHRAQGVSKQGPKLSAGRMEQRREAARAQRLWAEANKKKLKGDARYRWVCRQMGRDERTDPSWLYRLLRKHT